MNFSESGKAQLLKFEGYKNNAYLLQGVVHIGVGHTWYIDDLGNNKKPFIGLHWSNQQIDIYFKRTLDYFERQIDKYNFKISQNKFDAFFCTLYQCGENGFKTLVSKYIQLGDTKAFEVYYRSFRRVYDPKRRDTEVDLFFSDKVYISSTATAENPKKKK